MPKAKPKAPKTLYVPMEPNRRIWEKWVSSSRKKLIIELNAKAAGWKTDYLLSIIPVRIMPEAEYQRLRKAAKP